MSDSYFAIQELQSKLSKLKTAYAMRLILYILVSGKIFKSCIIPLFFIGIHEKYLLISFSWLELDEFVSMRESEPVTIDGHSRAYILRSEEMFHAAG